jgi:phosphate transport system substrate-binding protein
MRILIVSALIFVLGCNSQPEETTTRGNLHVFIPEPFTPVLKDEVNQFLSLYSQNGAKITYAIVRSETAARHFVFDSARIAFLPRPFTQAEKEHIAQNTSQHLNELIIAYDGIAAIVNNRNKMENLTTTDLQKILTGRITRWEQIVTAKPEKGVIKIYYQDSSDIADYMTNRLMKKAGITAKVTYTTSDLQTFQSIEKDPLSIGLVALAWIDSAKSTAKILNCGRTKEDTDTTFAPPADAIGKFFSPNPAYIYLNYYPLKRAIYMYTYAQVNLAAGFGTYVATSAGQKLFLNHGLLPGTQKIKLRSNQP